MTFLESNEARTVIGLQQGEKEFLLQILSDYPVVTNQECVLSRDSEDPDLQEDTELLRSHLEEITQENRKKLNQWLQAPDTFRQTDDHAELVIDQSHRDWFLQILNDIRVGTWHRLHCPDPEKMEALAENPDHLNAALTMELIGLIQSFILRAL